MKNVSHDPKLKYCMVAVVIYMCLWTLLAAGVYKVTGSDSQSGMIVVFGFLLLVPIMITIIYFSFTNLLRKEVRGINPEKNELIAHLQEKCGGNVSNDVLLATMFAYAIQKRAERNRE